ncbi:MAG: tetratricopeptide repeat protein [Nitrosopumilaceae archaeon]|nr:tetratricopeptide repeat protein [Nitrosopumilaceae archaeon]NIU01229.1 tetratricopeptide repeat protein [Nitrosopumilaceae archaeon]NIU87585.1 tetratricopeptide repeat protein [Nitrosopumilaceae archaeon]NIV66030.1 tetratricopeptide repeat protein [Nitrosopumilaceae archaeon]NIX61831.1 tetratricopeptide repeat protein [Nitrosopumilaceae archaeon]
MVSFFKYPKRHLRKLVQQGEYIEALDYGKSLESKFFEDPDYLFIMGSIYYILEEANKALPYFDKAISLKGDDVETLMLKTNAHLALQQKEEAIHCCKHILKIDPNHFEASDLLHQLEEL